MIKRPIDGSRGATTFTHNDTQHNDNKHKVTQRNDNIHKDTEHNDCHYKDTTILNINSPCISIT
jgi:hypothetical protein